MRTQLPAATVSGPEGGIEDFHAQIIQKERRRFERAAVREFVAAVRAGDHERCARTLEALDRVVYGWRKAMRTVANTPAPDDFRFWFRNVWLSSAITFAARSAMTSF
jgi:ribosome modulation factor